MKTYILLLFVSLLLFSCSKPVKIEIEQPPKIVIHGFLSPGELIKVNVSRSFSPMSDKEFRIQDPYCEGCYQGLDTQKIYLMKAKVDVFEDGVLLERLPYVRSGNYISQYVAKENSEYKLQVKAEGYKTISAKTTVPKKVDLDTLYFSVFSTHDQQKIYKVKLNYVTNSMNRYMFSAYTIYSDGVNGEEYYSSLYIGDRIEAGEVGNSSGMRTALYWEDADQTGLVEKEFYFNYYSSDGSMNDTLNFVGVLQNVNKSYYLMKKTIEKYDESNYEFGSLFTEPIQLFNNIENGLGSFSSYSSDTLKIKIVL